ncbi:hypothetical protein RvY_04023 [Ramazzottius varieornatus]|uniref:Leucine-rich repeat-containing protein 58 n=1 Tax=Ramazzottius varieornatus TaxID=947166 RepID=A0A1D1UQ58_RAMVA|nr:hypothetical protein RvY_04023 [Ramazzottius varieornatus]
MSVLYCNTLSELFCANYRPRYCSTMASDCRPSTSRMDSNASSSGEESTDHCHELDYSHSELESFELTFSNFSRRERSRVGRVSLSNNRLRVLPRKISLFYNIQQLDISGNQLESLSSEILKLSQLRILVAKNNRLTAEGLPKELYQLTRLEQINLAGNPLGSVIPDVLTLLPSLTYLHLGGCGLEEIPRTINKLGSLEVLYLGGNQLSDVPEELGFLPSLQSLQLNDNRLENLNPSIANLSQLRSLALHKNRLSSLPSDIIKLCYLRELSLRDNPLVRHFVRYLIYQPATLQEIAARVIKAHRINYERWLPKNLNQYLNSAHQCVNNQCRGVYFDSRFEHIKFVDFCGKYKVPFLEYLCSARCMPTAPDYLETAPNPAEADLLRRVLLG